MARRRRRTRSRRAAPPAAPRRRRTRRSSGGIRAGRAGFATLPGMIGIVVGAASAIGGATLLQMGANAAKVQLPQAVKDFAPLAGAGVIAALAMLAKRPDWTMPALIGGGLVTLLNKFVTPAGAGAYYRLRGAGNVQRALTNDMRGAGSVQRVLSAERVG